MSVETTVVEVKPYDPHAGFLVPFVVQRILDTSKHVVPEANPIGVAKQIIPRLYQNDQSQLVLAILDSKSKVVGHAVAQMAVDGAYMWATVLQIRADANVGQGQRQAMESIKQWAQAHGADSLVLITGRGDKSWEDDFGFKLSRQVKICDISKRAESRPAPQSRPDRSPEPVAL